MAVTSSDFEQTVALLCLRIQALLKQAKSPERRILIALAGVPGSGKTTISTAVLRALPSYGIDNVQVVPMVSWPSVLHDFSNTTLKTRMDSTTPKQS